MIKIKTDNDFAFGINNNVLAPLAPVYIKTKQQAYRAAAWIALMGASLPVDPNEDDLFFNDVIHAVANS